MHRRGGRRRVTLDRGNSFERSRYRLFDADGPPPADVVAAAAVAGVVVDDGCTHAPRQGGRSLYFFPLPHPSYRARIRRTRTFPVLRSGLVNVHRERLFLPRPPPPHPLSSHRGSTTAMYVWWRKMDGEGKRKVHRWVSYLHRPRENFKFLLLYSSFLNFFFFILLFSQEEKWIELYLKRYNLE